MNLEIRDPELLSSLPPSNVEGYLLTAGWKRTFADPRVFSIWSRHGAPEDSEVRVPLDPEASGYPQRVKELLDEIAATENRSQHCVFRDLAEWNWDAIRFSGNSTPEQSRASLSGVIDALESVRQILSAVAGSVETSGQVSDYMDSLEVSAFEEPHSIRVLARLGCVRLQHQEELAPFARSVSLRFRETYAVLHDLIQSDPAPAHTITGVVAEVCGPLSRLLRNAGTALEISVRLASYRPANGVALSTWRFQRADLETIEQISNRPQIS